MHAYDETGRYVGDVTFYDPAIYEQQRAAGRSFFDEAPGDPAEHFARDGKLHRRPKQRTRITRRRLRAGDGRSTATLKRIPKGATILLDGEPLEWPGGDLRLSADVADTYELTVRRWPFVDWNVTLEAR